MVLRLFTFITLVTLLLCGNVLAEVTIRVQVLDDRTPAPQNPSADALAQPQGDPVVTIETLADAGGNFLARTTLGKQVIELKGSVTPLQSDRSRVRVNFSNQAGDPTGGVGTQAISTNIELSPGKPHVLTRLHGPSGGQRQIVLTIVSDPAK